MTSSFRLLKSINLKAPKNMVLDSACAFAPISAEHDYLSDNHDFLRDIDNTTGRLRC